MLAMCYREIGDYAEGIKLSLRGIAIGLQLNKDHENGFFYNELGNMYSSLKQWDEAHKYFKKSLELAVSTKFPPGQSVSLRNLAKNAMDRNNPDEAKEYIFQSMTIDSTISWDLGRSRSYQSLAKLYESKSDSLTSIQYYRLALQYLHPDTDHYDLAVSYQGLSDRPTLERAKKTLPYGYIVKPFDERDLLTGIELALYKFSQEMDQLKLTREKLNVIASELLTDQEFKILMEMIQGSNNDQICQKIFISNNTLKFHTKNLMSKFDTDNRGEIMQKIIAKWMIKI